MHTKQVFLIVTLKMRYDVMYGMSAHFAVAFHIYNTPIKINP